MSDISCCTTREKALANDTLYIEAKFSFMGENVSADNYEPYFLNYCPPITRSGVYLLNAVNHRTKMVLSFKQSLTKIWDFL